MEVALIVGGIVVGLVLIIYGAHRFLLYAEQRGWVYYKHKRAPAGSGALAFLELMKIYRPEIEHVIEERGMRDWTEIGFSSIYYLLKKLEKEGLIAGRLEEVFGGEDEVEVQCPRCGRFWQLSRDALEGGHA